MSSRMGSYVQFSSFGLLLNHCYQFISKTCSSARSKTLSSTNSTISPALTRPLFFRRRSTADSSITNQDSVKICPFRFQYKKRANLPSNGKKFQRQCSSVSSADQMMNMMAINVAKSQQPPHICSGSCSRRFMQQPQYSSVESLPSCSDIQSEITTITSLSHPYPYPHYLPCQLTNQTSTQNQSLIITDDDNNENNNYEIMSGNINLGLIAHNKVPESEMPLI